MKNVFKIETPFGPAQFTAVHDSRCVFKFGYDLETYVNGTQFLGSVWMKEDGSIDFQNSLLSKKDITLLPNSIRRKIYEWCSANRSVFLTKEAINAGKIVYNERLLITSRGEINELKRKLQELEALVEIAKKTLEELNDN